MEWMVALLAATLLLLLVLWSRRPDNFPPGPARFPLVGSLPALAMERAPTQHDVMWSLARRHGPVMGLFLGLQPAVHVSGYAAVKHVLGRDDLTHRPDLVPVTSGNYDKKLGVFFTDGARWREHRRFTLRHLRDFGFGRFTMESLIHEEARALLAEVDAEISRGVSGEGADLLPLLPVVAINVLWAIMAGRRHELSDGKFRKLSSVVMEFFRSGNVLSPVVLSAVLKRIPGINSAHKKQISSVNAIHQFVEETIDEHVETFDENNLRDFIDVFLKEIKEQSGKSQLIVTCSDLFVAGTETTASTLGYGLRYMLQHPAVQTKLRLELRQLLGPERLPAMADIPKLPYLQAVVSETLRHSGLVPFAPPRSTTSDVEVFGYRVPKGTFIIANLWSVHMDPEIWGDPETFRPERFIDQDGGFRKDEHLLAFGYGPRVCLGEPLARFSTLLFLAALVQRFEFSPPGGGPRVNSEQMPGFTTSPKPFRMNIVRAAL